MPGRRKKGKKKRKQSRNVVVQCFQTVISGCFGKKKSKENILSPRNDHEEEGRCNVQTLEIAERDEQRVSHKIERKTYNRPPRKTSPLNVKRRPLINNMSFFENLEMANIMRTIFLESKHASWLIPYMCEKDDTHINKDEKTVHPKMVNPHGQATDAENEFSEVCTSFAQSIITATVIELEEEEKEKAKIEYKGKLAEVCTIFTELIICEESEAVKKNSEVDLDQLCAKFAQLTISEAVDEFKEEINDEQRSAFTQSIIDKAMDKVEQEGPEAANREVEEDIHKQWYASTQSIIDAAIDEVEEEDYEAANREEEEIDTQWSASTQSIIDAAMDKVEQEDREAANLEVEKEMDKEWSAFTQSIIDAAIDEVDQEEREAANREVEEQMDKEWSAFTQSNIDTAIDEVEQEDREAANREVEEQMHKERSCFTQSIIDTAIDEAEQEDRVAAKSKAGEEEKDKQLSAFNQSVIEAAIDEIEQEDREATNREVEEEIEKEWSAFTQSITDAAFNEVEQEDCKPTYREEEYEMDKELSVFTQSVIEAAIDEVEQEDRETANRKVEDELDKKWSACTQSIIDRAIDEVEQEDREAANRDVGEEIDKQCSALTQSFIDTAIDEVEQEDRDAANRDVEEETDKQWSAFTQSIIDAAIDEVEQDGPEAANRKKHKRGNTKKMQAKIEKVQTSEGTGSKTIVGERSEGERDAGRNKKKRCGKLRRSKYWKEEKDMKQQWKEMKRNIKNNKILSARDIISASKSKSDENKTAENAVAGYETESQKIGSKICRDPAELARECSLIRTDGKNIHETEAIKEVDGNCETQSVSRDENLKADAVHEESKLDRVSEVQIKNERNDRIPGSYDPEDKVFVFSPTTGLDGETENKAHVFRESQKQINIIDDEKSHGGGQNMSNYDRKRQIEITRVSVQVAGTEKKVEREAAAESVTFNAINKALAQDKDAEKEVDAEAPAASIALDDSTESTAAQECSGPREDVKKDKYPRGKVENKARKCKQLRRSKYWKNENEVKQQWKELKSNVSKIAKKNVQGDVFTEKFNRTTKPEGYKSIENGTTQTKTFKGNDETKQVTAYSQSINFVGQPAEQDEMEKDAVSKFVCPLISNVVSQVQTKSKLDATASQLKTKVHEESIKERKEELECATTSQTNNVHSYIQKDSNTSKGVDETQQMPVESQLMANYFEQQDKIEDDDIAVNHFQFERKLNEIEWHLTEKVIEEAIKETSSEDEGEFITHPKSNTWTRNGKDIWTDGEQLNLTAPKTELTRPDGPTTTSPRRKKVRKSERWIKNDLQKQWEDLRVHIQNEKKETVAKEEHLDKEATDITNEHDAKGRSGPPKSSEVNFEVDDTCATPLLEPATDPSNTESFEPAIDQSNTELFDEKELKESFSKEILAEVNAIRNALADLKEVQINHKATVEETSFLERIVFLSTSIEKKADVLIQNRKEIFSSVVRSCSSQLIHSGHTEDSSLTLSGSESNKRSVNIPLKGNEAIARARPYLRDTVKSKLVQKLAKETYITESTSNAIETTVKEGIVALKDERIKYIQPENKVVLRVRALEHHGDDLSKNEIEINEVTGDMNISASSAEFNIHAWNQEEHRKDFIEQWKQSPEKGNRSKDREVRNTSGRQNKKDVIKQEIDDIEFPIAKDILGFSFPPWIDLETRERIVRNDSKYEMTWEWNETDTYRRNEDTRKLNYESDNNILCTGQLKNQMTKTKECVFYSDISCQLMGQKAEETTPSGNKLRSGLIKCTHIEDEIATVNDEKKKRKERELLEEKAMKEREEEKEQEQGIQKAKETVADSDNTKTILKKYTVQYTCLMDGFYFFELEIEDLVSEGTFGKTYEGYYNDDPVGVTVFAEGYPTVDPGRLLSLRSHFVSSVLVHLQNEKELDCLIYSDCYLGNLWDLMQADPNRRRLGEAHAVFVLTGFMEGIRYISSKNIIHAHLTPDLVKFNNKGYPVICDFSRAYSFRDGGYVKPRSEKFNVDYSGPEIGRWKKIVPESDIFSAGCIAYEIVEGLPPFTGDDDLQTVKNVFDKKFKVDYDPEIFSKKAEDSISVCLRSDVDDRAEWEDWYLFILESDIDIEQKSSSPMLPLIKRLLR